MRKRKNVAYSERPIAEKTAYEHPKRGDFMRANFIFRKSAECFFAGLKYPIFSVTINM